MSFSFTFPFRADKKWQESIWVHSCGIQVHFSGCHVQPGLPSNLSPISCSCCQLLWEQEGISGIGNKAPNGHGPPALLPPGIPEKREFRNSEMARRIGKVLASFFSLPMSGSMHGKCFLNLLSHFRTTKSFIIPWHSFLYLWALGLINKWGF